MMRKAAPIPIEQVLEGPPAVSPLLMNNIPQVPAEHKEAAVTTNSETKGELPHRLGSPLALKS
jgi:hypothetical protein